MVGEETIPFQIVKTPTNTHTFYKDLGYSKIRQYLQLIQWSEYPKRIENSLNKVNVENAPVIQPLKGDTLLVFQGKEIKLLPLPPTSFLLSYQTLKSLSIPLDQVKYVLPLPKQRFIAAGHYRDSSKVFVYDYPTNDTLWKKAYPASTIKKMVAGEKTFVYVAGNVKIGTKTLLRVFKLDALSGRISWTFTEDSTSHQSLPIDLVFDPSGYITVVGQSMGERNTKSVLICRLDTMGRVVHLFKKESPHGGDNTATCAELITNGEIWIGGNFLQSAWKNEGFIYRYSYSTQLSTNTRPEIKPQQFEVLPSSFKGQNVGKVTAVDAENDALAFAITAGNTDSTFTIHKTTGILSIHNPASLAGGRNSFSLTVEVTEQRQAPLPLQSSALIMVVVKADTSLTTGIENSIGKGVLLVFPNPTSNELHLSLKNDWHGQMDLVLLDGLGREIKDYRLVKRHEELYHVMDLRTLEKGMYIVKLTYGQQLISIKVFKQ